MKHTLIPATILTLMGSVAFAGNYHKYEHAYEHTHSKPHVIVTHSGYTPSQSEVNTILSYAPDADVYNMSKSEVAVLIATAYSDDSEGEKRSTIRALAYNYGPTTTGVTEGQMKQLEAFAPDVNFHAFTPHEQHIALSTIYSENRSDAMSLIRSFEYN